MSYKGELQSLTKLSMRHQVCPSETCRTIISESIITMLISGGRSNCGDRFIHSIVAYWTNMFQNFILTLMGPLIHVLVISYLCPHLSPPHAETNSTFNNILGYRLCLKKRVS